MKRINIIKNQLTQVKKNDEYISSACDYLNFDQFLNKEEREYRLKLRTYLQKEVSPKIGKYNECTEFPYEIVKKLADNFPGIYAPTMKGYGGAGFSNNLGYAIAMEIARIDMSLAGFWAVQGGEVVMKTIYMLGSEKQKEQFLPKLNTLEMYGAFCLTEPNFGSNAYEIETSAYEDKDGNFVINGVKRWIGQGTMADVYIVWARNKKSGEIEGYLVEKHMKGIITKKIEGKLGFRAVQNGEVTLKNVIIPKCNKLEKANNFNSSVSKVFLGSRIGAGFAVAGMCIGAYEKVIEYLSNRSQFNKKLSSFQLIQEKLAIIMANTQAIIYITKCIADLNNKGEATMGMAGLCKAWCTSKGRETIAVAREILGGDGILDSHYVIRAMGDMEALYTAEGTYEINMLLAGKELTGKLAIV